MESVVGGRWSVEGDDVEYLVAIRPSLAGPAAGIARRCARLIPMSSHSRRYGGAMRRRKRTSSRRPSVCLPGLLSPLTLQSPTHRSLSTTKA